MGGLGRPGVKARAARPGRNPETGETIQQGLGADPFDGALYAFRGSKAGLIKLLWHDGVRLCMLTKRLEQGVGVEGYGYDLAALARATNGESRAVGAVIVVGEEAQNVRIC